MNIMPHNLDRKPVDPVPQAESSVIHSAILLEQNDEWAVQRARYMTLETIAPLSNTAMMVRLSAATP